MNPTLILSILLVTILHTHSSSLSGLMSFSSQKNSDLKAFASSSSSSSSSPDEIPIFKDLDGYYVNVDFATSTSSSSTGRDTGRMMLGLSSSDVLLIQQDCLDFKSYNCPYYRCNKLSEAQQTVSYPDFTAETIQASSAYVSLDHANWKLQGGALLATSCSTQRDDLKGANRYGVLGLGTQGSSKDNFLKSKIFSISFTSDVRSGVLKFYKDDRYFFHLTSLPADSNWVAPLKGNIQGAGVYKNFEGNIAFDMNADAIGFPAEFFKIIVKGIEKCQWMSSVTCTNDTFQPTCNYTGRIEDLPSFHIYGQYQVSFSLNPETYVKNAKSRDDQVTSITLNFQQLNSSLSSGKSFVTSDYENTIVLDARAMSYFYTVFDASGPRNIIELWDAKVVRATGNSTSNSTSNSSSPNPEPNQGISSKGPLLVGLVILMSIAASCAIIKKCNNSKVVTQAPVIIVNNSTTIVNNVQDYSGVVGVQNNHQYIPPPCNVGYGGYIHQENQYL